MPTPSMWRKAHFSIANLFDSEILQQDTGN
jgi:hypothetical protein